MNAELVKKLRLSPEMAVLVIQPPNSGYLTELGLSDANTKAIAVEGEGNYDYVLLFATSLADLEARGPEAIRALKEDGMLWIAYPKGTSKIKTDLNRDTGWKLLQTMGMEGVAMISMDDTWSVMRYRSASYVKKPSRAKKPAAASVAAVQARAGAAEVDIPEDVAAAFGASPAAEQFFGTQTAAMRRDYVNWVTEAKREDTRAKRLASMVGKLEQGLKRPTDKL
ncbi:YdeI/OmpD-associated family protein [Paenibacillus harenae]|uniref:Ribosomal protein L25 (General stress protein Ctc) n=1 Tax=Paenibacillus harenae TaxID=306543 RepID=A0ABT9TTW7_PAEHA|nr:YdeI/OmpD-associated family protein [Paenibacillus harenae]MDQ0110805.1 ribosomal protein L25 (general stress protein Ctc) [Paenibacillus harenae]